MSLIFKEGLFLVGLNKRIIRKEGITFKDDHHVDLKASMENEINHFPLNALCNKYDIDNKLKSRSSPA